MLNFVSLKMKNGKIKMGYMNLNHWQSSDNASDIILTIFDKIAKTLTTELKDEGNEFNTSGCENVAFFNEAFLYPIRSEIAKLCSKKLRKVLQKTAKKLKKEIDDTKNWEDQGNAESHRKAYKRLLKKLNKTLEAINEL